MFQVLILKIFRGICWNCKFFSSILDGQHIYFSFGQVNTGLECGMAMDDYNEWQEGDILEAFNSVQKKRTLEEASASMAAALKGVRIEL